MDHVAIMKKSWGLLPLIVSGEKTIESRWYMNRSAPWGRIAAGDRVFFKNTGEPVTVVARVSKVLAFENLTPARILELLRKYGKRDGIASDDIPDFAELMREKRYALLVFLADVKSIKPFEIDTTGFGAMSAWLTMPNIDAIKRKSAD